MVVFSCLFMIDLDKVSSMHQTNIVCMSNSSFSKEPQVFTKIWGAAHSPNSSPAIEAEDLATVAESPSFVATEFWHLELKGKGDVSQLGLLDWKVLLCFS